MPLVAKARTPQGGKLPYRTLCDYIQTTLKRSCINPTLFDCKKIYSAKISIAVIVGAQMHFIVELSRMPKSKMRKIELDRR